MSKAERADYKKYLLLERFLGALSMPTLRDIADTWVDPGLKSIKSKPRLIDALLEDKSLVKNAVAPVRSDGTVLFTLKHAATEDEIDNLLDLLGIDHKSSDALTHKAILESLKLVVTAPLEDVASYRQEAIQWRKGEALKKARGARSKKAAKKRKVVDRQKAKETKAKEAVRTKKIRAAEKARRITEKARQTKIAAREKKIRAAEKEKRSRQEARIAAREKKHEELPERPQKQKKKKEKLEKQDGKQQNEQRPKRKKLAV